MFFFPQEKGDKSIYVPDVASGKKGQEPDEYSDAGHGDDKHQPPPQEDVHLLVEEVIW